MGAYHRPSDGNFSPSSCLDNIAFHLSTLFPSSEVRINVACLRLCSSRYEILCIVLTKQLTADSMLIEEVRSEVQPIPLINSFEHLSLYIQKHLSQSAAVCGSLW